MIPAIAVLAVLVSALPQLREGAPVATDPAKRLPSAKLGSGKKPEITATEQGKLYRWRAPDGTIHIESMPPPGDTEYEVTTFEIERTVPVEASVSADDHAREPRGVSDPWPMRSPLEVYTPVGFADLLARIEETARRLAERRRLLEELKKSL